MSEYGKLRVDVEGNMSGFTQMTRAMKRNADEVAKSWSMSSLISGAVGGVAGALSFGAIKSFFEGMIEKAENIKELSEQLDISGDSLQKWQQALDKAHVSQNVFFRSFETLRNARQEALAGDVKQQEKFLRVGINPGELRGMSDMEAFERVLASGKPRALVNDLLGPRGSRLTAAQDRMGKETPVYSSGDLATAETLKSSGKTLYNLITRAVLNLGGIGMAAKAATALFGKKQPTAAETKATEDAGLKSDEQALYGLENQRELEAKEKKDREAQVKLETAEERLRVAKRQNMTAGARRKDMKDEVDQLNARIKYYMDVFDALSPADKEKMTELQTRREGLMSQLREKPMSLPADSLAKSGLFSGSALNTLSGSNEVLTTLKGIERNTSNSKWHL
jgi:hypothetical protein